MISLVFNKIFYEPLLNGLAVLVNILPFHDVGFAIIILTILVRFIIFPFTHSATVTQTKIKKLEPELKEIKNKFKNDNQEQTKKIMELYKKHGINPITGLLSLFFQIPILFALYRVFTIGNSFAASGHLYSFISAPGIVNNMFLGFIDMTQSSYILAALAAVSQFFQIKLMTPPVKKPFKAAASFKENLSQSISIQSRYIMPLLVFYIGLKFSSALALYWTTMNIFAIVHEVVVNRKTEKIMEDGTTNRNNQKPSGENT